MVPNPKTQIERTYAYDQVGELLSIHDSKKGKFTYGYDKLGRVTHAKTPSTQETFSFDPAHNLIEDGDLPYQGRARLTLPGGRSAYPTRLPGARLS